MPRIAGINYTLSGDTLNGPVTLLDNQSSPVVAVTYTLAGGKYIQLQYSIERNGMTRTGRLMIAHDGVNTTLTDDQIDTSLTGITFSVAISGSDLLVKYTSTNTGFNGALKYYEKRWN